MNTHFSIKDQDIHLWRAYLPRLTNQLECFTKTLSHDETERANRFRFAQHRERFILTRGVLRHILSLYTDTLPAKVEFSYGPRGKPYLKDNPLHLYFNASHSHDMAIFGLANNREIGVDIEFIEPSFKEDIAKRFFNQDEYRYLMSLPKAEQINMFYAIWARKEALIKALGEGLYTPLTSFSVIASENTNLIEVSYKDENHRFHAENFNANSDYQAAFAIKPPITKVCLWEWQIDGSAALTY